MAVRIKHVGRYREIAMALVRHGFGYMVEELGLFQILALPRRWMSREAHTTKTLSERIRLVLQELGRLSLSWGNWRAHGQIYCLSRSFVNW